MSRGRKAAAQQVCVKLEAWRRAVMGRIVSSSVIGALWGGGASTCLRASPGPVCASTPGITCSMSVKGTEVGQLAVKILRVEHKFTFVICQNGRRLVIFPID